MVERRGAGGGGVGDALALVVEPAELRGDARQLLDPAAPEQQLIEVADRLADDRAEAVS